MNTVRFSISLAFAGILAIFAIACGPNKGILESGKETPTPTNTAPTVTSIEKDIEDMRTANFQFIYVLRRKDGGTLDAEDKSVIKLQTAQANRRVSADGDKAVVVGSNFALPPQNYVILLNRFAVENLSQQPIVSQPDAANANK